MDEGITTLVYFEDHPGILIDSRMALRVANAIIAETVCPHLDNQNSCHTQLKKVVRDAGSFNVLWNRCFDVLL